MTKITALSNQDDLDQLNAAFDSIKSSSAKTVNRVQASDFTIATPDAQKLADEVNTRINEILNAK